MKNAGLAGRLIVYPAFCHSFAYLASSSCLVLRSSGGGGKNVPGLNQQVQKTRTAPGREVPPGGGGGGGGDFLVPWGRAGIGGRFGARRERKRRWGGTVRRRR